MSNINLGLMNIPGAIYNLDMRKLMHESFLKKSEIKKKVTTVLKTGQFAGYSEVAYNIPNDSEIKELVKPDNDQQVCIKSPTGKVYYCNDHTYFNYWLQAKKKKIRMEDKLKRLQRAHPRKRFDWNIPVVEENPSIVTYERQSKKPKEGTSQTFEQGCGGFAYNLLECMIEIVSDLPEYTLIEADEPYLSDIISKALNYNIHEPHYHGFFSISTLRDEDVTTSGIDEKKRKMYERLDQVCSQRNIYIDLENYSKYIYKDTVVKEYNITITDDENFQKIFGCKPQYRKHITETDREYQDGRHEQLTSSYELAKKSSTKLRTVTKTTHGFMKYTDHIYTLLEVIYEDGTKGLTYSYESDSG